MSLIQWCPTCQSTRMTVSYSYEDTRQREHVCNVCGTTISIQPLPVKRTPKEPK